MKKIGKLLPLVCLVLFTASVANAQLSVSINIGIAPPALPVVVQPPCPVDNYIWVPGYWAYDNVDGYYWVPGVWVAAPQPGLLWTPAYWGYAGGNYGFHAGYWGPHVGFYGGVNYGGGYGGYGFIGGAWSGGSFRYNTAVVNVNTTVVHNTYIDRTVINNTYVNNSHSSFNGPGGVNVRPKPEELAAMREQHVQPTAEQTSHQQTAHRDPSQFAKNNGGHPTAVAMNKVGGTPMNEHGQVAANSKLGNQNANRNQRGTPNAGVRPANNASQQQKMQQQQQRNNQQRNQQQHNNQQRTNQQRTNQQRTNQQRTNQQQHRPAPQPKKEKEG